MILCEIFLGLEYLLLDCKGYIAWGAIVTTLVVLIPLFMCFKSRNNKKRSRFKIEALEKELADKEREINVLEKELAGKKRGKFIKRWLFHRIIEEDCNWYRTHNHLVHKRTLNHLAKLAN